MHCFCFYFAIAFSTLCAASFFLPATHEFAFNFAFFARYVYAACAAVVQHAAWRLRRRLRPTLTLPAGQSKSKATQSKCAEATHIQLAGKSCFSAYNSCCKQNVIKLSMCVSVRVCVCKQITDWGHIYSCRSSQHLRHFPTVFSFFCGQFATIQFYERLLIIAWALFS